MYITKLDSAVNSPVMSQQHQQIGAPAPTTTGPAAAPTATAMTGITPPGLAAPQVMPPAMQIRENPSGLQLAPGPVKTLSGTHLECVDQGTGPPLVLVDDAIRKTIHAANNADAAPTVVAVQSATNTAAAAAANAGATTAVPASAAAAATAGNATAAAAADCRYPHAGAFYGTRAATAAVFYADRPKGTAGGAIYATSCCHNFHGPSFLSTNPCGSRKQKMGTWRITWWPR